MIEKDGNFAESRRQFYECHYRVAEPIDHWHAYAQGVVHATTRTWFSSLCDQNTSRVLNAGSGGSDYGIASPMVHLDLIGERVSGFPEFLIGDVSQIPAEDASFDAILCVGSVINYANPIRGIGEFQRILRPGGLLILEYERSGSAEYWLEHGISAPCSRVRTFYGGVETQLWAYSDQFVDGLLAVHGFETIRETRFHGLSSLVLAVTGSPRFSSRFVFCDSWLANMWPVRHFTSNRILAVKKLAH